MKSLYICAHPVSLDKQIGQLFIVGAYSNAEDAQKEGLYSDSTRYVEDLIKRYQIGGVLFKMQWNPQQVQDKTAYFQNISQIPLLTCLDAEWGLSQRMRDAEVFPKNYALGSLNNLQLVYETGKEIGRQCREIGINVNFSPVVDINTNPTNPIINHRSFGSDSDIVAACGIAMMKGLQDGGVLACAKHFPGHGDTSVDSHTGLPMVAHGLDRLHAIEYIPFTRLIDQGVDCVMGAHLMVPVLDPNLPTSLSPKAIQGLLKGEMGFEGLAVTDDLIMGAVTQNYSLEEAVVLAYLAGNDLILLSRDVEKGIQAIAKAVDEGRIHKSDIQARVNKINKFRKKVKSCPGVDRNAALQSELYTALVKMVEGKVVSPELFVQVGGDRDSCYFLSDIECCLVEDFVLDSRKHIAVAIFGMEPTNRTSYGIKMETIKFIQELVNSGKVVTVILHGDPQAVDILPNGIHVVGAYDHSRAAQEAVISKLDFLFRRLATEF